MLTHAGVPLPSNCADSQVLKRARNALEIDLGERRANSKRFANVPESLEALTAGEAGAAAARQLTDLALPAQAALRARQLPAPSRM